MRICSSMLSLITEPSVFLRKRSCSDLACLLATPSDRRRSRSSPSSLSERRYACLRYLRFCFFGGVFFFCLAGGGARLFLRRLGDRLGDGVAAAADSSSSLLLRSICCLLRGDVRLRAIFCCLLISCMVLFSSRKAENRFSMAFCWFCRSNTSFSNSCSRAFAVFFFTGVRAIFFFVVAV